MGISIEGTCTLLQVFDMRASLAFYRDLLGYEVVMSAPPGEDCEWCLLRHGDAELMLNTQFECDARPPVPDPARAASHGDTCLFLGCRDLDGAYEHLRSHGVAVEPPVVRAYGMRQLPFSDPDGYGICLQWQAE